MSQTGILAGIHTTRPQHELHQKRNSEVGDDPAPCAAVEVVMNLLFCMPWSSFQVFWKQDCFFFFGKLPFSS